MRVARNLAACLSLFAFVLVDARMRSRKPRRVKTVQTRNATTAPKAHRDKARRGASHSAKLNASSAVALSQGVGGDWVAKVTESVCMQVDVGLAGGFLTANFAVGVDITFDNTAKTLAVKGMIGGGVTAGLLWFKAAMYAQGSIELTAKTPAKITSGIAALKWALKEWVDNKKKTGPMAKIANAFNDKFGKATAIDKIILHRNKIIGEIVNPTDSDEAKEDALVTNSVAAQTTLIEDGFETHRDFIHAVRTSAQAIITEMGKKSSEADKKDKYLDGIEKAWRSVYRNDAEVGGYWKPKCSKIADKKAHPSKLLMCAFFKYGMYLEDNSHDGSKGNANTRAMLPVVYDELFKVKGTSVSGAGEMMTAEQLVLLLTNIDIRYTRQKTRIAAAQKAGDTETVKRRTARMYRTLGRYIRVYEMEGAGLIYLFALPEADLRKSMQDMLDATAPEPCELSCGCGVIEIELEGTIGFTFGSSGNGFCTPDTNPFQMTFVSGYVFEKKFENGECKIVRKASNEQPDDVFMVTVSGSSYVGLDIGWHYDTVTGNYKGWEVNLRIRVPIDGPPPAPVNPTPQAATALSAAIKMFMGDDSEQGFASKGLETKIAGFFETIFGKIQVTGETNAFMNAISGGWATSGISNMVKNVLKKVTGALTAAGLPSVEVSTTKTIGFDIGFEKTDKKEFTFAFDYLAYLSVTADMAIPSTPLKATVGGYKASGSRYEYAHEWPGKAALLAN